MMSEVLNEYSDNANCAKECSYFREVFAGTPIDDFVYSGRVRDTAFWGENMPYNSNLSHAQ